MTRAALVATLSVAVVAGVSFLVLGPADAGQPPDDLSAIGEQLYDRNCVSCHGSDGVGTSDGPTLVGVGEASADFQLRTGRMPRANSQGQAPQKPPAFSDQEIQALVTYVGSLGEGPAIPRVREGTGDLADGGELYRANCQSCHGATAIGGALSFGDYAPDLRDVAHTQIAEAVRVGPGQMPVFDEAVFSDEELASIVRYVEYLQDPADPGGFSLGRIGPVTEGYVIWVVGAGAVVLFIRWITRTRRERSDA